MLFIAIPMLVGMAAWLEPAPDPSALTSAPRLAALSCGSSVASLWRPSAAISAPITATPNVPPTMRIIERMPEATPALA